MPDSDSFLEMLLLKHILERREDVSTFESGRRSSSIHPSEYVTHCCFITLE